MTMKKSGTAILPLLLAVALIAVIGVALASQFLFNNTGTVTTIGLAAYHEATQVNLVTTITWGDLEPGDVVVRYIYVNSTSNVPVALNLTTADWTPLPAADYLAVTWNLEDATIQPFELLEATLTLTVSPDITGVTDFSFTAIITAEEP